MESCSRTLLQVPRSDAATATVHAAPYNATVTQKLAIVVHALGQEKIRSCRQGQTWSEDAGPYLLVPAEDFESVNNSDWDYSDILSACNRRSGRFAQTFSFSSVQGCMGSVMVNVLPLPTVLVTWILPPCASTNRLQIGRPKPIPFALVVKRGL